MRYLLNILQFGNLENHKTNLIKGVLMKLTTTVAVLCSIFLFTSSHKASAEEDAAVKLETEKDSVSYVLGTNIAKSLINIKEDIDIDMLTRGIKDQLNGKPMPISEEAAQTIMREFTANVNKKQEEQSQIAGKKNLNEGVKFLEENKKKDGIVTTESGLQYQVLKKGDGPVPTKEDKVKTHYKGTLTDGTEFDSSHKRGEPAVFPVTGVIKGWTEALQIMNVGSKYKLFVPSELAYGQRGAGQMIGPNSVLIFEIELLGIEK